MGMRRGRDQADVEAQTCAGGRPVFRQACELFVKNAEFTGNGLQSRVLLCYNKLAGGWRVGVPVMVYHRRIAGIQTKHQQTAKPKCFAVAFSVVL